MNERGLNNVLRQLRISRAQLNVADAYASTSMDDQDVNDLIGTIKFLTDKVIKYLDKQYRFDQRMNLGV